MVFLLYVIMYIQSLVLQKDVKILSKHKIRVKIQKKSIKILARLKLSLYLCIVNQDKLVDKPQDLFLASR